MKGGFDVERNCIKFYFDWQYVPMVRERQNVWLLEKVILNPEREDRQTDRQTDR